MVKPPEARRRCREVSTTCVSRWVKATSAAMAAVEPNRLRGWYWLRS